MFRIGVNIGKIQTLSVGTLTKIPIPYRLISKRPLKTLVTKTIELESISVYYNNLFSNYSHKYVVNKTNSIEVNPEVHLILIESTK